MDDFKELLLILKRYDDGGGRGRGKWVMGIEEGTCWDEPFVAMWMELDSVMLSEISHTEKDRYRMVSLLCGS